MASGAWLFSQRARSYRKEESAAVYESYVRGRLLQKFCHGGGRSRRTKRPKRNTDHCNRNSHGTPNRATRIADVQRQHCLGEAELGFSPPFIAQASLGGNTPPRRSLQRLGRPFSDLAHAKSDFMIQHVTSCGAPRAELRSPSGFDAADRNVHWVVNTPRTD